MDIPFHSDEAIEVNKNIFKTIYHAALEQSAHISYERSQDMSILKQEYLSSWSFKNNHDLCQEYIVYDSNSASSITTIHNELQITELLRKYKPIFREIKTDQPIAYCGAYSSFSGSPASEGILQFDMWNVDPNKDTNLYYDWDKLKENIKEFGLRNSLLVAPMPTASTSQILGNNECFEPLTSNIYTRRTLAGEFVLANKYLIRELTELGMWNERIKNNIILNKGSIQYIDIPQFIKDKYKIVWEIPMKHLINMSRDRGAYICQSQSLNLWMEDPNAKSLTNMHFYGWNCGLKTGIYYLRRKPRHQPQQFTIEPTKTENKQDTNLDNDLHKEMNVKVQVQKIDEDEDPCMMCSG